MKNIPKQALLTTIEVEIYRCPLKKEADLRSITVTNQTNVAQAFTIRLVERLITTRVVFQKLYTDFDIDPKDVVSINFTKDEYVLLETDVIFMSASANDSLTVSISCNERTAT